jgi:3-phenylpropionate/cinnamic acid dioxygenase small subunit
MSVEEEIRRLLARYCQLCDDGSWDEWSKLFTDDAHFAVLGRTHEGPAAITAFIAASLPPEMRGKHLCANPIIDIGTDGVSATAFTDYVFVGRGDDGQPTITSVGRYHDELVSDREGWRFRRREIVFMGDEPLTR